MQIDTPEGLVTRPATDYVRRFVANCAARARGAGGLADCARGGRAPGGRTRPRFAAATIEEIAPRLLAAGPDLPVVSGGVVVGILGPDAALRVRGGGRAMMKIDHRLTVIDSHTAGEPRG